MAEGESKHQPSSELFQREQLNSRSVEQAGHAFSAKQRESTTEAKKTKPAAPGEPIFRQSKQAQEEQADQQRAKPNDQSKDMEETESRKDLQTTMLSLAPSKTIMIVFPDKFEKDTAFEFLGHHLETIAEERNVVCLESCDNRCNVKVTFPTLLEAEKALQMLQSLKKDHSLVLSWSFIHTSSDIESFQKQIAYERNLYLTKHDELITALEKKMESLQSTKKYIPLAEYERVTNEREVHNSKLEERRQQRKEYEDCTQAKLVSLSQLMLPTTVIDGSLQSTVERIHIEFARECNRLQAALPIYARRSEIIETILSHQVTILVGETGSGKSTQVVQYLYDAGVADSGLVVCTQPRKVAAITLAKHVCKEMQIELGTELGYRVGMSVKCTRRTKVLFMTDHALLNECITDRTLAKYSCILIDEAHERSINTDMLLAFIKQCLLIRQSLKVVVMSATIEPELFVRYFKQDTTSVSTLMVSGRTFPVEMEYNPLQKNKESPSVRNEHVMDAIEMVNRIHSTEPPGDILVFLTCPPEIEKACKAMEHSSEAAAILPLHGKLSPEEQQKVFTAYDNKRKIIFSTNIAETSVTIPGVKYVVDTGLAKEMHFDPRKNMDSLEIRLISKSSAEQRKGRAGRMSAGKCYRLYTTDEYVSNMPERTKPEILRIQLSQVVLKLLEFGVPNVLKFDFVEHPDSAALEAAVETLKFVGAIENGALSDTGKKMAALPLNPQLAKVLLDGINAGVGTEALCAVALSSLAGQVFFRGTTDEMKQESESMKLSFCHQMGDQMTSLSVFQCWQAQEKEQRKQWCIENFVNAKSMRIIEDTMKELRHILEQRLHIKLSLKLGSLQAAECYICKLYFDAFLNNLAVYLGNERIGYLTMTENSGTFVVFPGSALKQLGSSSLPKYVIYEKILKTSQQFLTQVMHVKQEWVDEAVLSGKLAQDPAEKFKIHMVVPLDVARVGPYTFKNAISKPGPVNWAMELKKVSDPQSPVSPIIDFSSIPKQWGTVRVFAPESQRSMVELAVVENISKVREDLKKESKECKISEKCSNTRIVIGAGGTVREVIMASQYRTVVAICPHDGQWVKDIESELKKYGNIEKIQPKQCRQDFRLTITYSEAACAQRAVSECKYPNVVIKPFQTQQTQQFSIKIQWQRRQRKNSAFLNFECTEHCQNALQQLGQKRIVGGYYVYVNPDKHNQRAIFLGGTKNCLCTMSEDLLRDEIAAVLGDEIKFTVKMVFSKSFEENDETHQGLTQSLQHVIAKHADPESFSVFFRKPNPPAVCYQAFVNFDDPEKGQMVLNSNLSGEMISNSPLTITPSLKCVLSFRKEIYKVIKESIEERKKVLVLRYPKVLFINTDDSKQQNSKFVKISITSEGIEALSAAQNALNSAAQPHMIECRSTELQEYIVSRAYHDQADEIQASTSTCMYQDLKVMCIKVYGTKENQLKAEAKIKESAQEMFSGGAKVVSLELGSRTRPPGLMRYLILRFGRDLKGMYDFKGVRKVSLNPRRQLISLLATSEGLEAVEKCIEEYSPSQVRPQCDFEVDCSACLTPIEDPKTLIRLEPCGHAYHVECIEMQLKSDTLTLPIECVNEDCSEYFLLKDFENLQKSSNFRIEELIPASLEHHLERNGDKYKYCTTPDCTMIYTKTDDGKIFTCSDCGLVTCTTCDEQYHTGLTCEEYQDGKQDLNSSKQEPNVDEWIQQDPKNRKKCPNCSVLIEKIDGCDRISCRCGKHICWKCLQYFQTEDKCYEHLRQFHGGYF